MIIGVYLKIISKFYFKPTTDALVLQLKTLPQHLLPLFNFLNRLELQDSIGMGYFTLALNPLKNIFRRLQILFNRNTFTGQSRFISVYVICEDLPFNETLTALITFRLVSQEEGYAGMDNEVRKNFIL